VVPLFFFLTAQNNCTLVAVRRTNRLGPDLPFLNKKIDLGFRTYRPGPGYFDKGLPKNPAVTPAVSTCSVAAD
jgi:hypothetical protein